MTPELSKLIETIAADTARKLEPHPSEFNKYKAHVAGALITLVESEPLKTSNRT